MNTVGVVQATMTFLTTSNGLASGNHLLEAIEHALCEIIERDTQALDSARGVQHSLGNKIDIESISDPSLQGLITACCTADLDIAVFEMVSDLRVPTFRAGLKERGDWAQWSRLGIEWGCGTHLSPVVALSRAVTEAAQARLTVIAGSRDDNPPSAYASTQGMWSAVDPRNEIFTAPPARPFSATVSRGETDTFEEDLKLMLGTLSAVGIDRAVVVDLTKEHIGIPVVKVVVPELEAMPTLPGYVEGARARRARQEQSRTHEHKREPY